jgi:hypothetical protein
MGEASTPVEALEPRYRQFVVTYPSGTIIESAYPIGHGGTVRDVALEHPMARVEPVEDSRVHVEVGP